MSDRSGDGRAAGAVVGAVAGAPFTFWCDAPDLLDYARAHLTAVLGTAPDAPVVEAVLHWHEGQPPANRTHLPAAAAEVVRVDRDLYTDGERTWWFRVDDLRDLHLRFRWHRERLVVEGDFYYRLGNSRLSDTIRRMRQWRQRWVFRQRRFPTLLAYLVYYPCWWWLEQMRDVHPIHAAAVATPHGVVLVAGASGVGKSTLALALAGAPGAQLLSDSFVLHNGLDILPIREPVLLDRWSRRWLGPRADCLRPLPYRYSLGRTGFQLPPEALAERGRAALVVFPRRASQPYVRRISPELAHHRLSAGDLLINDLRRYWGFAAVLEQAAPGGLMARREAHLGQLTAGVPSCEIGLTGGMSADAVTSAILGVLETRPVRVAAAQA